MLALPHDFKLFFIYATIKLNKSIYDRINKIRDGSHIAGKWRRLLEFLSCSLVFSDKLLFPNHGAWPAIAMKTKLFQQKHWF